MTKDPEFHDQYCRIVLSKVVLGAAYSSCIGHSNPIHKYEVQRLGESKKISLLVHATP